MKERDWSSYDVLVVDDEVDNLDAFRFAFRKSFHLHYAQNGADALSMLTTLEPALIVADQRMPKMSGVELLREAKERYPDTYAILLTAYADLEVLIDAVNTGAVDRYVQKPWDSKELTLTLRQGIAAHATWKENRKLREQLAQYAGYLDNQQRDPIDFGQIVGGGEATQKVLEQVTEVGPTDSPVVIEGEVGLEKEVVARAIHGESPRDGRPFVSVTCAAYSGDALERELFGYRRGSLDGALQDRAGRFELADGGTLFMHEPSELSPSLQARLLRLLSRGEAERFGETRARRVDVRLVMSASPNFAEAFVGQELMSELVSKLRVYSIKLLPVRQRRADIRALAEHFLEKYARRNVRAATAMSVDALARLESYDWPGNVREVENVVERAAILAHGDMIQPKHLSFQNQLTAHSSATKTVDSGEGVGLSLSGRLDAIERGELIAALQKHGGNKAEVARALGIHRTTLYYRIKKLGIDA
jgi:two-component system response regulator AtoC